MAEIIKGTEQRLDATTIAMSVGKVMAERDRFLARFAHGKHTQDDETELKRMIGNQGEGDGEGEELSALIREAREKLAGMAEFPNGNDKGMEGEEAALAAVAAAFWTPGLIVASDLADGSLTGTLNAYYGPEVMREEERYSFTVAFEWIRAPEVEERNRERFNEVNGYDFGITVAELGRETVNDLARFLREELGDPEGAAFIEGMDDSDDVFAAINYLMDSHVETKPLGGGGPPKLDEDGFPLLINDDEEYWTEYYANMEADYARLTDPDYVMPTFNFDSDYGYGYSDGYEFKWGDYRTDLIFYLQGAILDKANEVIRENEEVRARFLQVASGNFGSDAGAVPENYGLMAIPAGSHESLAESMGTADTDAAGRALERLKAWTFPEEHFYLDGPSKDPVRNDTGVAEPDVPGSAELWAAEKKAIYEEATARYQAGKNQKGLLREETV
ncbi:MAG: hypothetical protein LBR80_08275 [Deltaproteobacteria bacterium]|jgi:hypothetical protein|nr:hypothetical protein [Deltaproteobacteria bacterium]